jgi:hypothetical protein
MHTSDRFGLTRNIFPFDFAFRTIRTHVVLENPLTKDAKADERLILSALRQGQSYISMDLWNDPAGFSFTIYDEKNKALPGGEITRQGQAILEAKLPGPGRLRLVRDGRVVKSEAKRTALQWDVDLPGVYRIEALQHAAGAWRPWIYSNPIWVK